MYENHFSIQITNLIRAYCSIQNNIMSKFRKKRVPTLSLKSKNHSSSKDIELWLSTPHRFKSFSRLTEKVGTFGGNHISYKFHKRIGKAVVDIKYRFAIVMVTTESYKVAIVLCWL